MLVYGPGGSGPRIGAATLTYVHNPSTSFKWSSVSTSYADVQLQGGDSGSPVFAPWINPNGGRELTILGTNAGTDSSTLNSYNYVGNSLVMGAVGNITANDGFALRVVGTPAGSWLGGSGNENEQPALNQAGNWQGDSVPNDVFVRFDGDSTASRTITVDAKTNFRGVAFTASSSGSLGFAFSGTNVVTIGRGGVVNYMAARQNFAAPLMLGATQYWDVGTGGVTASDVDTNGSLLEIAGRGTARIAGSVSGNGGLALTGHRLELSGTSSYSGRTWVHAGTFELSGSLTATQGIAIGSSGILAGSGRVSSGIISGSGRICPGTDSGILTAASVDPTAGLGFVFEFTKFGPPLWGDSLASGNDVLRLTSATPFVSPLSATNTIDILLGFATPLSAGVMFQGGFFADANVDLVAAIENANFSFWQADAAGAVAFNGINYSPYSGPLSFMRSVVPITADFGDASKFGYVIQFEAVPEPSTWVMGLAGIACVGCGIRRRRRAPVTATA